MEKLMYLLLLLPQITVANYSLYRVTAFNEVERSILYKIHFTNQYLYFINGVTNEALIPMDIVVEGSKTELFEKKLIKNNIQFSHFPNNYLFDNSFEQSSKEYKELYNWDAVNTWISEHITKHRLRKIVIAKTFESRDLFVLKLTMGERKTAVFIMGGECGMDWLTPAIIFNLIKEMLEKGDLRTLTEYYDFYFLPFMNPDGYVYSMNVNQYWTKNRKIFIPQVKCTDNYTAAGVNLDRNWHFEKSMYNAIDQECNAVYIGQFPLSEEETQALSYVLNNLALGLMAFINLKGSNRLITIPYVNETVTVNHDILMELITMASVKVKEKYNVTYYVGTTTKYIYNASGNVADWVKKMLNIPIVYTVYLKHENNFVPRLHNIESLGQQFKTILNETLIMARDIYGPLFNGSFTVINKNKMSILCVTIVIILCQ